VISCQQGQDQTVSTRLSPAAASQIEIMFKMMIKHGIQWRNLTSDLFLLVHEAFNFINGMSRKLC
jgi:hypothetical protein